MTPTRQEFLHLSPFEKYLFYALVYLSLGYMLWQIGQRVRVWKSGRPIGPVREGWKYWLPTKEGFAKWLGNLTTYVIAQKKVRSSRKKSGAPMHLLIFYGFLALFIATGLLALASYAPYLGLPNWHRGRYFLTYETVFDILGLLFIAGLIWALARRAKNEKQNLGPAALREPDSKQQVDKRRKPMSSAWSDYAVLSLLLILGLTGYWLEAARISSAPQSDPAWDKASLVGYAIAQVQGTLSPDMYRFVWWFHMVWVLVFFAAIPRFRLRHIVMAILSTAGKPERPMGHLKTIPMEEVEETGQIGVKLAQDYSRWHLMSLDACMECGRCTEVCPAWNVGKVLNPKQVVQDIRGAMVSGQEVVPAVSEEALWACTTCNACVEACPVLIRHVDLIVDSRRYLVAEGKLSGTAATMLRQTASTSNAWGAPANSREDWMKDLDIPLCRNGVEFEYLFWVGCAGATDPGAIKTTKAVAHLLKKAGVSFACLGQEEACTGDPARRVGDEFLFQEKAMGNSAVFEAYGVKKVVTACPHCLNTFKNEYGEFGAKLEVYHHSQLLQELITKDKLKSAKPNKGEVTFHDPCYLGRVNNESDAPRAVLGDQTNLTEVNPDGFPPASESTGERRLAEPAHRGKKTLCCGAGGGRMWMEEPPDQRPGNRRAQELLDTGAKTVAVGCPFCRIMLDASIKQVSTDEIRLVDLAEMLQEANA